MSEEGSSSSDSDWILIEKEINDFIKLEAKIQNLQITFVEVKEKTVNLEKKNVFLENELKKIQKINFDNKDEIDVIKHNFKKLIEENIKQAKARNNNSLKQKNENINYLEEEIIKASDSYDKIFGDLIKLNNLNFHYYVNFVKIKNKWGIFCRGYYNCCKKYCNTRKPLVKCIEGNGFGKLIDDENIKYINGDEGKGGYDHCVFVYAEKAFYNPQNSLNHSLYYFEIKCKFERELNSGKTWMVIGLENLSTKRLIWYSTKDATLLTDRWEKFKLSTEFNDGDILGCGLVYPPANEFPYVFFTQNGKQIGLATLLLDNYNSYKPFIYQTCCSVEANFGNDLESKPFKYDISKHLVLKNLIDFFPINFIF
uniref:Uncharacterized protein n=1 Tax=Meloidogyne enterolobii TaxID=390850 RepID=A0A6V7VE79_MELEN|nr:unnamed protein product [Meloidogyne enterolobii]